jgi:monofunctional glycosyltransferase
VKPAKPFPSTSVKRGGIFLRLLKWLVLSAVGVWLFLALSTVSLRWMDPPVTMVRIERKVQARMQKKEYHERHQYVPLDRISADFQHAVIAAEDSRFYQHHGFDWEEIQAAVDEEKEDGRLRGASTLTQQLVKNLYFGTGRSFLRKGVEATLVPVAEYVLGKKRILELYLNEVEWAPGVFGAEAAAQFHYKVPAKSINRQQGARLAAVLPSPLRRKPERMNDYSAIILERMGKMGW